KDFFGDRSDAQRLPGSSAGDDSESLPRARQLAHACAVIFFEKGFDAEPERQLDGLARGSRGRDHDHAAGRRLRLDELLAIRREPMLMDASNHKRGRCKDDTACRCPLRSARAETTGSVESADASCRLAQTL